MTAIPRTALAAALLLVVAGCGGVPQPPPPIGSQAARMPPAAAPRSETYDPYTSGVGPCPEGLPGDEPCGKTIAPSQGQPSYWTR